MSVWIVTIFVILLTVVYYFKKEERKRRKILWEISKELSKREREINSYLKWVSKLGIIEDTNKKEFEKNVNDKFKSSKGDFRYVNKKPENIGIICNVEIKEMTKKDSCYIAVIRYEELVLNKISIAELNSLIEEHNNFLHINKEKIDHCRKHLPLDFSHFHFIRECPKIEKN